MRRPLLGVIVFLTFLGDGLAFWRLNCDGSTVLARLDPLMSPGKASAHTHSVKGGSGKSTTPLLGLTLKERR